MPGATDWPKSWGLALRLAAVAGAVVVAGGFSNALAARAWSEVLETKQAGAALVARLFATSVAVPMDFGDDEGIRTKLEDLRTNAQASYAGVWRVEAPVAIATFGGRELVLPLRVPDLTLSAELLEIVEPVSDPNGRWLGTVLLGFSLAAERARFEETRRRIWLYAGLCLLVGSAGLLTTRRLRRGGQRAQAFSTEVTGQGPGAGEVVGQYQLLTCVGQGGMGRVWAARQVGSSLLRLVAVKTSLQIEDESSNVRRLFLDEGRLASSIRHPNVCGVYEFGEQNGVLYQVLEWCDGGSLRQLLDRLANGRMDYRVAARLTALVCAGLHAAHELEDEDGTPLRVVHRDVSPHNILIARDGQVQVTDFGVAKAHGQLHRPTETGEIKGKIGYMAPEQVTTAEVDRRADVFALGCVLYEATTGKGPFQAADALATLYQLLSQPITSPVALVPGYPEALANIVLQALAKEVHARYQTAEEFGLALQAWLAQSGDIRTEPRLDELMSRTMGKTLEEKARRVELAISQIPLPTSARLAVVALRPAAANGPLPAMRLAPVPIVVHDSAAPPESLPVTTHGASLPPVSNALDPLLCAPPRPVLSETDSGEAGEEPAGAARPTVPAGRVVRKPASL